MNKYEEVVTVDIPQIIDDLIATVQYLEGQGELGSRRAAEEIANAARIVEAAKQKYL